MNECPKCGIGRQDTVEWRDPQPGDGLFYSWSCGTVRHCDDTFTQSIACHEIEDLRLGAVARFYLDAAQAENADLKAENERLQKPLEGLLGSEYVGGAKGLVCLLNRVEQAEAGAARLRAALTYIAEFECSCPDDLRREGAPEPEHGRCPSCEAKAVLALAALDAAEKEGGGR